MKMVVSLIRCLRVFTNTENSAVKKENTALSKIATIRFQRFVARAALHLSDREHNNVPIKP